MRSKLRSLAKPGASLQGRAHPAEHGDSAISPLRGRLRLLVGRFQEACGCGAFSSPTIFRPLRQLSSARERVRLKLLQLGPKVNQPCFKHRQE